MERLKNGLMRLPPGFRFHPTDEELVVQYLKRKVLAYPLPVSIIPDVDVCKSDPWDLPGDSEQERYFFSTREVKYPNGNRSNRATGAGYWKATGLDKQIVSSKFNQVVGMKKTLVFYRGKPPKGCRTDWIMHEYRLNTPSNLPQAKDSVNENWVLCRVFLKRRGNKNNDEEVAPVLVRKGDKAKAQNLAPVFYDFMAKGRADLNLLPANSSSGSSGITDMSKRNESSDDPEESSSCNSFTTCFRKEQCP